MFLNTISVALAFSILISHISICSAKYVLVSSITCDRYSLDALYHEKYEIVTEEVLTDSLVFVKNVIDKVEDSLQQAILKLPGHDKSSQEEMALHRALTSLKDVFERKIKRMHNNITSNWNNFIEINHRFLGSEDGVTFDNVTKYANDLSDAYGAAKKIMDEQMGIIVSSVKVIIQNGLLALTQIVESADHDHHNHTESPENGNKTNEEKLKDIIKDVVPLFLRTVTEKIVERKVNLSIPVNKTLDDRDSVLDDLFFAVSIMRRKVNALEPELSYVEEHVDLARRNLYILWADTVHSVYKDKISEKSKDTPRKGSAIEKFEKFWSNEDELANTLVSLMKVYP